MFTIIAVFIMLPVLGTLSTVFWMNTFLNVRTFLCSMIWTTYLVRSWRWPWPFLGRVALGAQRIIVVKLSRERSVGQSVGLSSALWKNGGLDPDAVQHRRSDGSRDEAAVGFEDRSTGRGTFGGEFVARHCPQGPTGRTCATAPRRGPLAKLLWADLLHISSCNMDRLNKIFNFVFLSYWLQRDRDGTGNDSSGNGTGSGTTYQPRAKLYFKGLRAIPTF